MREGTPVYYHVNGDQTAILTSPGRKRNETEFQIRHPQFLFRAIVPGKHIPKNLKRRIVNLSLAIDSSPHRSLISFYFVIVLVYVSLVGPAKALSEEIGNISESAPDTIDAGLEQRDQLEYDPQRKSLFPELYQSVRQKRMDWWHKHDIELTLSYDAAAQTYNDRDWSESGSSGDLSLRGRWLLFGKRFNKPVYLSFQFRDRHAYTDQAPSDIKGETDLLWGTVKGFNNSGFQVPDFYIDQELLNAGLTLRYGQFSIDKFVDKHALRSAKRFFLNQAFSDNPTVGFPSYGAGFAVKYRVGSIFEFTAGGSNIQGTDDDRQIDLNLDSTALFGTLQAAARFSGIGNRPGRIQVMGWNSENNQEDEYDAGKGVSVTLEQEGRQSGESFAFRYALSEGNSTDTDTILFLAYGRKIRNFDHFGIGAGSGRSSDSSEWQTVLETYYRWQVTKELLITPDLQVIFGNDSDGNSKVRLAGGIRVGIVF